MIVLGIGLFLLGLALSGENRDQFVSNQAVSIFGSIRQSIRNATLTGRGKRDKTRRDWIGWSISAAGLLMTLYGLLITVRH
jgi:secreted protein with Ig-like and vWFA domain